MIKNQEKSYQDNILTVAEYLELVNEYLKPLNFSIIGEVSSVTDRAGGTVFFSVSDEEEKAKIDCVIWRNVYRNLGFKLEEGMQVKINGYPNIYKPRGSFSYVARSIIPTGEGALLKAFEQLKAKLEKEGYFAPERKRALPQYITKIGLITAGQSDAKKDFETHIGNFGAKVYFADVRVEGFKAVDNIVQAIRYFNENPQEIEVLVITRGGGSLESLQAFNSEGVARAVYSSKIPVLSAIGHERDVTISDLVADVRGSTPTDAGKIVSKDWREATEKLHQYKTSFINRFANNLKQKKSQLRNETNKLLLYFQGIFQNFTNIKKELNQNSIILDLHVKREQTKLSNLQKNMLSKFENGLNTNKQKVTLLEKLILAHDPKIRLKQGYTLTRNSRGKIIKSVSSLKRNDILSTHFIDGKVSTKITKVTKVAKNWEE